MNNGNLNSVRHWEPLPRNDRLALIRALRHPEVRAILRRDFGVLRHIGRRSALVRAGVETDWLADAMLETIILGLANNHENSLFEPSAAAAEFFDESLADTSSESHLNTCASDAGSGAEPRGSDETDS